MGTAAAINAILKPAPAFWRFLAWISKRVTPVVSEKPMRIRQTLALGEKRSLVLVEVDGERLVIGVTGSSIAMVHRSAASPGLSLPIRGVVE